MTNQELVYTIAAYNSEAHSVFGTPAEANRYADYLNQDRDINLYFVHVSDDQSDNPDIINLADISGDY